MNDRKKKKKKKQKKRTRCKPNHPISQGLTHPGKGSEREVACRRRKITEKHGSIRATRSLKLPTDDEPRAWPSPQVTPGPLPLSLTQHNVSWIASNRERSADSGARAAATPPSTAPESRSIGSRAVGIWPLEKQKFLKGPDRIRCRDRGPVRRKRGSRTPLALEKPVLRAGQFVRWNTRTVIRGGGLRRYPGLCTCTRTNSEAGAAKGPALLHRAKSRSVATADAMKSLLRNLSLPKEGPAQRPLYYSFAVRLAGRRVHASTVHRNSLTGL